MAGIDTSDGYCGELMVLHKGKEGSISSNVYDEIRIISFICYFYACGFELLHQLGGDLKGVRHVIFVNKDFFHDFYLCESM